MAKISVVIPTYNRCGHLRACLEALLNQTHVFSDFEVIVVVDGSTDGTREMLNKLATPYALHVVWQTKSGQCAARNRGVEVATGNYCLFLDDDITAAPNLITEHLRGQLEHGGAVGLGQIRPKLSGQEDRFARAFMQSLCGHYERLNQGIRPPDITDCYSGNLSVPRDTFLAVGGFNVNLPAAFDIELGYRLKRKGLPLIYIPNALGHHHDYKDFRRLATDIESEGRAFFEMYSSHPPVLPYLVRILRAESLRALLLRRILHIAGLPNGILHLIGRLLIKQSLAYRWDRFLRKYFFWRGVRHGVNDRNTWHRLTRGTLILMYHAFGRPSEGASRYIVPARLFKWQMAWLKFRRYCILTLDEFVRCHREYQLPPAHSIVITIDDGYADSYDIAYPILSRYQFPATIFLVSGAIGSTNQWDGDTELADRSLLSWSSIHKMLESRLITYGVHTQTHRLLTSMPREELTKEIEGSRSTLEEELGLSIPTFAYPFGECDPGVQSVVEQAGFLGACGTRRGVNGPATCIHNLHRIEIRGCDSLARFILSLWAERVRAVLI